MNPPLLDATKAVKIFMHVAPCNSAIEILCIITLWCVSSPIENVVAAVEVQVLIFGVSLEAATEPMSQNAMQSIVDSHVYKSFSFFFAYVHRTLPFTICTEC